MGLHKLFLFMLLVAGVCCAPKSYKVGTKIGYSNIIDAQIGGEGQIVTDGLSFDYQGKSRTGAHWKPNVYGGVYAQNDKDMYVADVSLGGLVGNYVNTRGHYAGGLNSKGNIPLVFKPGVTFENAAYLDPQAGVHTGEDAWQRAMMYGAAPPRGQYEMY